MKLLWNTKPALQTQQNIGKHIYLKSATQYIWVYSIFSNTLYEEAPLRGGFTRKLQPRVSEIYEVKYVDPCTWNMEKVKEGTEGGGGTTRGERGSSYSIADQKERKKAINHDACLFQSAGIAIVIVRSYQIQRPYLGPLWVQESSFMLCLQFWFTIKSNASL